MRVAAVLTGAFVALAAAQDSSAPSAAASSRTTTSLTPKETCLNACKAGDVTCQAACVGVPHPGEQQMDDTTRCVADCDQGDGSAADSRAYAQCRDACISSYIITSSLASVQAGEGTAAAATVPAGVTPSGGSASGSASPASTRASASASSESTTTDASSSPSDASQTASGAAASSTGAAVGQTQMGVSVGGIAGLVLAVLAL